MFVRVGITLAVLSLFRQNSLTHRIAVETTLALDAATGARTRVGGCWRSLRAVLTRLLEGGFWTQAGDTENGGERLVTRDLEGEDRFTGRMYVADFFGGVKSANKLCC